MAEANCGNCRYWLEGNEAVGEFTYEGTCRRYPPTIPNDNLDAFHPPVDADWWCGEHATANPETAEEAATILARFVLLGDCTAARALADKLRE